MNDLTATLGCALCCVGKALLADEMDLCEEPQSRGAWVGPYSWNLGPTMEGSIQSPIMTKG